MITIRIEEINIISYNLMIYDSGVLSSTDEQRRVLRKRSKIYEEDKEGDKVIV